MHWTGIILPGTTQDAFVTIPDEFIGTGPRGGRHYRCRLRPDVMRGCTSGDLLAFAKTRTSLYLTFAACHAGFRANLLVALNALFIPSGGLYAGVRVNQTRPGTGGIPFPC